LASVAVPFLIGRAAIDCFVPVPLPTTRRGALPGAGHPGRWLVGLFEWGISHPTGANMQECKWNNDPIVAPFLVRSAARPVARHNLLNEPARFIL
jgi:hypothetical protein